MVNEVVIMDSDMVWYVDTGASNHVWAQKSLSWYTREKMNMCLLESQQRFPSKVEEKYVFLKRMENKAL